MVQEFIPAVVLRIDPTDGAVASVLGEPEVIELLLRCKCLFLKRRFIRNNPRSGSLEASIGGVIPQTGDKVYLLDFILPSSGQVLNISRIAVPVKV